MLALVMERWQAVMLTLCHERGKACGSSQIFTWQPRSGSSTVSSVPRASSCCMQALTDVALEAWQEDPAPIDRRVWPHAKRLSIACDVAGALPSGSCRTLFGAASSRHKPTVPTSRLAKTPREPTFLG